MRITVYKTELNDDLHTELIKERAYNYSTGNLSNPDAIVNLMNDVFHMNKLSEEYLYMIVLIQNVILLVFLKFLTVHQITVYVIPEKYLTDYYCAVQIHLYYCIIILAEIVHLARKILQHLKK